MTAAQEIAAARARAKTSGDHPNAVAPDQAGAAWRMTLTTEDLHVENDGTEYHVKVASDWDGVLLHFGLNPDEFEVVDDEVKISSWQQSKRTEDGDRDLVWLYAYKARFRRVTDRLPEADVAEHRARVQKWRPTARRAPKPSGRAPATFYAGWADWQIGKDTPAGLSTEQRVLDSFQQTIDRIKELRRIGRPVEALAIANMGDPTEGCDGNYASQLNTIKMHRRDQLNTVLDLWETGVKALAPLFEDVQIVSVLCNHGEWTRQGPGTRAVTSDSDNIGGYLPETLRRVLAGRSDFDHVRFVIPRSEMTVMTRMSGVPVALAHGHKTPGTAKELEWMQAQSLRLLREHGVEPRLWMTAHRHHYEIKDHGPWTRIQHPSLDFGSKWYSDASGKWSTPGTFTCLVGEHDEAGGRFAPGSMATGFSDEHVLLPAA